MCGAHHRQRGHPAHCCEEVPHSQHGCCCGGHHPHREDCGCGAHPFRLQRRFTGRREEAEDLERYLKDLEAEAEGVRERLAELNAS